ncbi:MAG: hypothetical protein AAF797_13290 [Planctomycetota bacterium]
MRCLVVVMGLGLGVWCTGGSAVAEQAEPAVQADPPVERRLHPSSLRLLQSYARHCVYLNGHVWSVEHAKKKQELDRWKEIGRSKPTSEAYDQESAPLYVNLVTEERASSLEDVVVKSLPEEYMVIGGPVQQVHHGVGVMVTQARRDYMIQGLDRLAEGDVVPDALAIRVENYTYTTIRGVSRTIACYRLVGEDEMPKPRAATAADLEQAVFERERPALVRFMPRRVVDQPGQTTVSKRNVGGMTARKTHTTPATFKWVWIERSTPIRVVE